MKAKFLKSTLSLALALCMTFSLSSVCFAVEPADEPALVGVVDTLSMDGGAESTTVTPRSGFVSEFYPFTLYYAGQSKSNWFYLDSASKVSALWRVQPVGDANTSAEFTLKLRNQETGLVVYTTMKCDTSAKEYYIGFDESTEIPAGNWQATVSGTGAFSGTYNCGIQFYAH